MNKTHWIKAATGVGAACILTIGLNAGVSGISASTLCQETGLAGFTVAIDAAYTDGLVESYGISTSSAIVATSSAVTASAVTTPSAVSTSSAVTGAAITDESSDKDTSKKKDTVSDRWKSTGVSIAKDYVNIRKKPSASSKAVAKLHHGSAATILSTHGKWVKVESGSVKGYIKKSYLATGKRAEKLADKYATTYAKVKSGTVTLNVRKKKSTTASIVAQIGESDTCVVQKAGQKWAKVKVDGKYVGYVAKEYVSTYVRFKKATPIVTKKKSSSKESVSSNSSNSSLGSKIASYAQQFVGNDYQWGGTSLTNGTDCSGFTMSVYAKFGYSLPRTSAAQSGYGTKIKLSNLKPGDLVFFLHGSRVGHVAMYIGNGQIVHAAGEKWGIIISNLNYDSVYCARRIVG